MKKVSIIVPFRNASKYIEKCLKNLYKQKYNNYEIILIDDGSSDNSKNIIEKYIKKDEKLKYFYIEKTKLGVGTARNYGIEKATGDYIMFVDVDDYINENLLFKMSIYMKKNIDMIKYQMEIVQENGNKIKNLSITFSKTNGKKAFENLCFKDKYLDSPCLYLIKKEYINTINLRFSENTYHEDFGLIPILIIKAKTVVSTNFYGYSYVQSDESIMRNNNYSKLIKKVEDKFMHYENMIKICNLQILREYYTNSIIISLKDLQKKDRLELEQKIYKMKLIKNLKTRNIKQFIKKVILYISIEFYLYFIKNRR